jgi:hypothetical protein
MSQDFPRTVSKYSFENQRAEKSRTAVVRQMHQRVSVAFQGLIGYR